VKIVRPI